MSTPTDTILAARLASDPGAPLVTHYDEQLGSRIELSVASTANWAAKIAGLLRDEVGIAPGDSILLDLPAHWLTAGVVLGAWWAGAEICTSEGPAPTSEPVAVVTTATHLNRHDPSLDTIVMSLDPMARPVAASGGDQLPPGVIDLTESCRIHPDAFIPSGANAQALDGKTLTDLAEESLKGRILLAREAKEQSITKMAHILASGGSMVLVTGLPATSPAVTGRPDATPENAIPQTTPGEATQATPANPEITEAVAARLEEISRTERTTASV